MNFLSKDDYIPDHGEMNITKAPDDQKNLDVVRGLAKLSDLSTETANYNSIFSLVRKAVKSVIGKERVGLGLALASLPPQLGAFWQVGGNYIVMNRNLLDALKYAKRPANEINSFVFVILMHEYLHSLGVLDEQRAREITAGICATIFEKGHPAFELGTKDPWQVYPFLAHVPGGNGENLHFVGNFDSDSVSYIM